MPIRPTLDLLRNPSERASVGGRWIRRNDRGQETPQCRRIGNPASLYSLRAQPLRRIRRNDRGQEKRQAGFTYLWMLLMVAFMGVALTLAAEVDQTIANRDREKSLLAIGREFQRAIGSYYENQQVGGKKEYPASLEDLLQDPRFPGVKRHLRKIYTDPMTGKSEWGLKRVGGRIVGIYSLSEKTPIKQANFEVGLEYLQGAKKYSDWVFVYPSDLMLKPGESNLSSQDPSIATKPGAQF